MARPQWVMRAWSFCRRIAPAGHRPAALIGGFNMNLMQRRLAAGFAALTLTIGASAPATAQALFSDVSEARAADVSPSQSAAIQRIMSSAATRSLSIVRVDGALLRGATANQSIEINIDLAVKLNATSKKSRSLNEGRFVWKGEISGDALPNGSATIVMNGDNATGTIQTPDGRLYRLQPIGDGRNALIEVDRSKVPPDHEPGAPPMPRQKSQIETAPGGRAADVAPDTPPVIDLVVAYTTNAMNAHGDILSLIDLAIAETNESFANSGISASVRLVHTVEYSYSEAGKTFATMVGDFGEGTTARWMRYTHFVISMAATSPSCSSTTARPVGAPTK